MTYTTNEHLELLQALDNHVKWLKESYADKGEFFFHIKKLEGLIGDLADYFGAKKKYVQREPDTQVNPDSLGMYPGVPHKDRTNFWAKVIDGKQSGWADDSGGDLRPYKDTEIEEKRRLYGKYGDVFNQDTIGDVDERWK